MASNIWLAPTALNPVFGTVSVPGSKSITNRALILAALSDGPSRLLNVLESRDVELMTAALGRLGARFAQTGSGQLTISPIVSGPPDSEISPNSPNSPDSPDRGRLAGSEPDELTAIDCGLAGTVMRFLPPVAALSHGRFHFDGDEAARLRPMAPLLSALEQLGVSVTGATVTRRIETVTRLPFDLRATGRVTRQSATIDASKSSQFVSALLLAAARYDQGLRLQHRGPPLPSLPHIQMTIAMLSQQGVEVSANTSDPTSADWYVPAGPIAAMDRTIEPDLSNAMPFVAAAIVTGGSVTIPDWPTGSLQPLERVANVFTDLGAQIQVKDGALLARGTGKITGINADLGDIGELVPTIAAVCALADGPSHLTGIGHLAGHETNRLTALATEINTLGGQVENVDSGLRITPVPLSAGPRWQTYQDHRMATAGAILGLVVPGIKIENIATTSKTFPSFPQAWRELVATEVNPTQADPAQAGRVDR